MNAYWIGVIILAMIYYAIIFPFAPNIFKTIDSNFKGKWDDGYAPVYVYLGIMVSILSFLSYWIIPLIFLYITTIPVRRWLKKML